MDAAAGRRPIPIHWGLDGQVDGYAPKEVGLSLLPVTAIAIAALLAVIPRFEPRRANLERSGKAYGAIWVAVVTLLGGVHVLMVAAALGADCRHLARRPDRHGPPVRGHRQLPAKGPPELPDGHPHAMDAR